MKIGEYEFEIAEPDALDSKLSGLTGCNAAEVREMLLHPCLAGHVAAALVPFIKDAPPRHDLADLISRTGVPAIQAKVLALYDKHLGIEPPPPPLSARKKGSAGGKAKG